MAQDTVAKAGQAKPEGYARYEEDFQRLMYREDLDQFLQAVWAKGPAPIDVFDSVIMFAVILLSERSIAHETAAVEFPDFTRGRWKSRTPAFAMV